jgi:6-phosphofructokinase 1
MALVRGRELRRRSSVGRQGNLVVGQSGGATAVINASLAGAVREALAADAFDGVYGARYGIRGVLENDLLDLRHEPPSVWDELARTPSAALGSCRYRLREDDSERALRNLQALGVRTFLYIGGNDSADTAHQLAEAAREAGDELRVICVPKTIDNDLPGTDHCPGYGSAARFLAQAIIDSALCTLAMPDHYPVKIVEVMGRDAGWLAAASALGKRREEDPPHLICFPERPLIAAHFLEQVQRAHERYGYVVVVVAETVRDEHGTPLGSIGQQGTDEFGHRLLSGAGQYLVSLVTGELGLRARFDKPGDLQRMSSSAVSPVDRAEAELVGRAAVRSALGGETDKMVTLVRVSEEPYHCETGLTSLECVANAQRPLPSAFVTPDWTGVTEAFRAYALPLLGEHALHVPARLHGM